MEPTGSDTINISEERKYTLGTRSSELAKVQTYEVIDLLLAAAEEKGIKLTKEHFPVFEIGNSIGDTDQKTKLFNMGGQGVFCKQLEQELLGIFLYKLIM